MKKYIVVILVLEMLLFTSCNKLEKNNLNSNIVKIWLYEDENNTIYTDNMDLILDQLNKSADENNIELEIRKYSSKELSYDNYILKRNAAIASCDVDILFDNAYNLYSIKEYSADYNNLSTFTNVFKNLRQSYCIPIISNITVDIINNDVLDYFNIKTDKVIMTEEYYEIKQKMKESGAKFKFNEVELNELIKYYINKNNIEILKSEGKLRVNEENIKNTINQIYQDIMKNYDVNDDFEISELNRTIFEKTTESDFSNMLLYRPSANVKDFIGASNSFTITNYSLVLNQNDVMKNTTVPCLFINNNTKNENTYKIASILFDNDFQKKICDSDIGETVIDTKEIRKYIGFDENWNYTKIKIEENSTQLDKILSDMMQKSYKIIRFGDFKKIFSDYRIEESLQLFIKYEILLMTSHEKGFQDNFRERLNNYVTNLNVRYN